MNRAFCPLQHVSTTSENRTRTNLIITRDGDQKLGGAIVRDLAERPTILSRELIGVARSSGVSHMRKFRAGRGALPFGFYGVADRGWDGILVDKIASGELYFSSFAPFDCLAVAPRTINKGGVPRRWRWHPNAVTCASEPLI